MSAELWAGGPRPWTLDDLFSPGLLSSMKAQQLGKKDTPMHQAEA